MFFLIDYQRVTMFHSDCSTGRGYFARGWGRSEVKSSSRIFA